MTVQAKEKLIIDNKKYLMISEPLESYLQAMKEKVKFDLRTTGCWRGYVGTWKLENEKLYLIDLVGTKYDSELNTHNEVGMEYLFPNQKSVFANWFSGQLEIPDGTILMEGTTYLGDFLFLKFDKGVLIDFKSVDGLEKMVNDVQVTEPKRKTGFLKKVRKWFFPIYILTL